MADVHKLSERVIDLAQRFDDVVDAAEGKGNRGGAGIGTRWLLLPAAGAGLYALMTSNSVGRHAKGVIDQAKTRAAGCDGYVAKPFSPRHMLQKVREFIG